MPEPSEKYTRCCDVCDEYWEPEFFCEVCSSESHIEEVEVPNVMWDGCQGEEYVMAEEVVMRDVCLNCCQGNH